MPAKILAGFKTWSLPIEPQSHQNPFLCSHTRRRDIWRGAILRPHTRREIISREKLSCVLTPGGESSGEELSSIHTPGGGSSGEEPSHIFTPGGESSGEEPSHVDTNTLGGGDYIPNGWFIHSWTRGTVSKRCGEVLLTEFMSTGLVFTSTFTAY